MNTISNATRSEKGRFHTDHEAYVAWVNEYAEAHDMPVAQVLELALFRLEEEKYVTEQTEISSTLL